MLSKGVVERQALKGVFTVGVTIASTIKSVGKARSVMALSQSRALHIPVVWQDECLHRGTELMHTHNTNM